MTKHDLQFEKDVFAFTLPGWFLSCDRGELASGWEPYDYSRDVRVTFLKGCARLCHQVVRKQSVLKPKLR